MQSREKKADAFKYRLNFAAGFFGVRTYKTDYHQLITVENGGINNTLASPETCDNANNPNIGGLGTALAQKWIAKYLAPATTRLAPMVHGVDLNIIDIFEMQLTCAYEVSLTANISSFCTYPWLRLSHLVTPSSAIYSLRTNGGVLNMQLYVCFNEHLAHGCC